MGLERTALPTSWGRIGPECVNLTVPLGGLEKRIDALVQCMTRGSKETTETHEEIKRVIAGVARLEQLLGQGGRT